VIPDHLSWKALQYAAIGVGSYGVVRCMWAGVRYLIQLEDLKDLPRPEKLLPIVDAFGQHFSDFYNAMRDPKDPTRFHKVVNIGPSFNLGQAISINDPDMIAAVLEDNETFIKPPTSAIKEIIGNGLALSTGAVWHRQRKLLTPMFHFSALKDVSVIMAANCKQTLDRIHQTIKDKGAFECTRADLGELTLSIIIDSAFSRSFDHDWMVWAWQRIFAYPVAFFLGRMMVGPLWCRLPIPSGGGVRFHRQQIAAKIRQEMVIRRKERADGVDTHTSRGSEGGKDLLDELIAVDGIPDEMIVDEALTFLLAGHETTASVVTWAMYFLATRRDVQDRLQSELDSVVPAGETITFDAIGRLDYLRCFVKETLRMYPPVPFVGRVATKRTHVGTQVIPKGTFVWLSAYAVHRDSTYWDEPDTFKPERWADAALREAAKEFNGETPSRRGLRHTHSFIPFGAGPRNCIGQKFALLEAQVMVASLLRDFDVSLPPDYPPVIAGVAPTLVPMGLKVHLTERKKNVAAV